MELIGLVLQAAFLGLAFGLRTYLHVRRTGSTGFRVGARRSRAEALGAGGITAAAITSLAATVLVTLDIATPLPFLDFEVLRWSGVLLAVLGIVLVVAAQSAMGTSWRIGVDPSEKTLLVTGGLFAFTRNPTFLGMLTFWSGIALLVPDALSIAALVIAFIAVEVQVRYVEEPYLVRTHGDAYVRYASQTGRFLPGIGRLPGAAGPAA